MKSTKRRPRALAIGTPSAVLTVLGTLAALAAACNGPPKPSTPIEHVVIIFGENISFDHYFGTYPTALNPAGDPAFTAAANTPKVNGLTPALLTRNPNSLNPVNGTDAKNPFRIARLQAGTSSQNHVYGLEQMAYDGGKADLFPRYTGVPMPGAVGSFGAPALVMGYFDGNTVTALWNYAQHFAMSDNAYADQYGPSTPGALNLVAGQTNGITISHQIDSSFYVRDGQGGFTLTNDAAPAGDICTDSMPWEAYYQIKATGKNIGDLLSAAGVRWGWFEGGFDITAPNAAGKKGCLRTTISNVSPSQTPDYIPHHEPFQYYASTANPHHARPSSAKAVGSNGDGANHQYDIHDFFDAVNAGSFPEVSYLKASAFQDGHAGYSDPLDEQTFIVQVLNFLQQRPEWPHTAVIIVYDDSDGWYDHQFATPTNASFDRLTDHVGGDGACGTKGQTPQLGGVAGKGPVNGRCGPGTRQPFLMISPWARTNYVDHTLITQASVPRFVEDNWLHGARIGGGSFDAGAGKIDGLFDFSGPGNAAKLFLDDSLGTPTTTPSKRLPR